MGQWSCSPYAAVRLTIHSSYLNIHLPPASGHDATPNSICANALVFYLLSGGVSQCGVKSPRHRKSEREGSKGRVAWDFQGSSQQGGRVYTVHGREKIRKNYKHTDSACDN